MTVVYEIVDETEWRKTNPLRYAHNGLTAVTVSASDAIELLDEADLEIERLKEELKRAVEIADDLFAGSCGDWGCINKRDNEYKKELEAFKEDVK
jgi:hypothetical protein